MMGLFSRRRKPGTDIGGLGATLIALRLDQGDVAPAHSTVVVFNPAGYARRVAAGKVSCEQSETVFCFDPGPYTVDLVPFAAAPEWGLRLRFVVDAANPRVSQQRFDLYLYSETAGRLELADFAAAAQMALQAELARGALDLPPCTLLEEWHTFRGGLNQLMYTRYGVTVDDCVPVDLGEQVDYAAILQERARQAADAEPAASAVSQAAGVTAGDAASVARTATTPHATPVADTAPPTRIEPTVQTAPPADTARHEPAAHTAPTRVEPSAHTEPPVDAAGARATPPPRTEPSAHGAAPAGVGSTTRAKPAGPRAAAVGFAEQDARALRRLFLELPALSTGLRLLSLPEGLTVFQQHQSVLLRLGMAALNVNTMPALAWAAPDQPLPAADQALRSAQTLTAQTSLDEGWSLLARLQLASPEQWPALLDEADRICANLETGLSLRRTTYVPRMEPSV